MSALLAANIARLTVGAGTNPRERVQRRGLEILIEATTETQRADLDRKTAMYLAGLLVALLPLPPGRRSAGENAIQRALQTKVARKLIAETALQLRPNLRSDYEAALQALEQHGEHQADKDDVYRIARRMSDMRHRR